MVVFLSVIFLLKLNLSPLLYSTEHPLILDIFRKLYLQYDCIEYINTYCLLSLSVSVSCHCQCLSLCQCPTYLSHSTSDYKRIGSVLLNATLYFHSCNGILETALLWKLNAQISYCTFLSPPPPIPTPYSILLFHLSLLLLKLAQ